MLRFIEVGLVYEVKMSRLGLASWGEHRDTLGLVA